MADTYCKWRCLFHSFKVAYLKLEQRSQSMLGVILELIATKITMAK